MDSAERIPQTRNRPLVLSDVSSSVVCKSELRSRVSPILSARTIGFHSSARRKETASLRRYSLPDSLRKHFSLVTCTNLFPSTGSHDPRHGNDQGSTGRQQHNQRSRRVRFLLRYVGSIKHLDYRDFLRLLDLSQFVLLGEKFVDGFLDFGLAVEFS